jgi:hypothetical protein
VAAPIRSVPGKWYVSLPVSPLQARAWLVGPFDTEGQARSWLRSVPVNRGAVVWYCAGLAAEGEPQLIVAGSDCPLD